MNKKIIVSLGVIALVTLACTAGPKVVSTLAPKPAETKVESVTSTVAAIPTRAMATATSTYPPLPTLVPEDTETPTPDECTIYEQKLTVIISKFEESLKNAKADILSGDMTGLSHELSQGFDFAYDDLSVLVAPAQFAGYQADFLNEIQIYQKGSTAHLHADHGLGNSLFQEADALEAKRKGTTVPTCK